MSHLNVRRRGMRTLLAVAAAVAVVAAASPARAHTGTGAAAAPPAAVVAADLSAAVKLSNCSASLVRFPTSVDTDRGLLLTNGHCLDTGMPGAGEVIVDRASTRTGTLLNAAGSGVATITTDRLLYATMTGTDAALYRLTQTFATIRSQSGITARTISGTHPSVGSTYVPSGYFQRIFPCDIAGFVPTLKEDAWIWRDSVKYDRACEIIHGTSGSPIVSTATGEVVEVNNTANDDGQRCTLNNPCEVAADGTVTVIRGQGYGQQTYWFVTCVSAGRTIDLNQAGCLLTKPGGSQDPVVVANPGDQSGVVGQPANLTLSATGGTGTTTWSATGLPTGLSLNTTTGVVSGTPTTAGTYQVRVTATRGGQTGSTAFTWTVTPRSQDTVTVTNPGDQSGVVGQPANLTLSATGGTGTTTWSATGLPTGLSLNTTTGVVSGTPTTAGTYQVRVTATRGGQSGSTAFTWTVTPGSGGGCGGVSPWSASTGYSPNDQVSYNGHLWKATWWSTGAEPGSPGSWAVWSDSGAC